MRKKCARRVLTCSSWGHTSVALERPEPGERVVTAPAISADLNPRPSREREDHQHLHAGPPSPAHRVLTQRGGGPVHHHPGEANRAAAAAATAATPGLGGHQQQQQGQGGEWGVIPKKEKAGAFFNFYMFYLVLF